ncbi:MAG: MFS transporter [Halieaceae bacterium]|jgi:MFS family permease|nr:MFS transporter [Halieaceae bacterium]
MRGFTDLIRQEWRLLAYGFAMMFACSYGQTYFIALFGGEIRADLSLSHSEFGAVYSAATLASALLLLKTGSLIDRLDLRVFSLLATGGLALGGLVLASATSLPMLFVAFLLLRQAGQGLMGMAGPTAMVRYLPEQRGKATALTAIGFSVSEAILPSAVFAMLAILSWRQSWWVWTALLVALLPPLIHILLKGHPQRHAGYLASLAPDTGHGDDAATAAPRQRQWTRDEVIRDPLFYLFMPALVAQPMLFTGFMFHQVHMVEVKGWSLALWGGLYTLYALASTVVKLFAGVLVDRYGAIRLVPLICLPFGLGLLVLASANGVWVAFVFMLLLAVNVGIYGTLSSPFFAEKYGTLHLGAIKSVTTAVMVFSSAIAPVLMGWLIDAGVSIEAQALGGVIYTVLAAAMAWKAMQLTFREQAGAVSQ